MEQENIKSIEERERTRNNSHKHSGPRLSEILTDLEYSVLEYVSSLIMHWSDNPQYKEIIRLKKHQKLCVVSGFTRRVISDIVADNLTGWHKNKDNNNWIYQKAMDIADEIKQKQKKWCKHGHKLSSCVYECEVSVSEELKI